MQHIADPGVTTAPRGVPRATLALCVAISAASASLAAQAPRDTARQARSGVGESWHGADKAKHALLAGFVYAVGFSAARLGGVARRPALAAAAGPVVVLSVGKEAHDRRRGGRFSARDLVADALGAAAYAALLARTTR
jgi:uncharacterized protein YfiM (DUF2279 family)